MSIEEQIKVLDNEIGKLYKGLLRLKGLAEDSDEDWERYITRIDRINEIRAEIRQLKKTKKTKKLRLW